MKYCLFIFSLFVAFGLSAGELKSHCDVDAAKVSDIVRNLKESDSFLGDRVVYAAKALEGSPEDDYYKVDSIAELRINLDSHSPLMFLNNVIALAKASLQPSGEEVNTFSSQLVDVACRRGENNGFPSVMYHISDWIIDNATRGNLREMTEDYEGVVARTKSLDEMTRNRSNFAALSNPDVFEAVRMMEMGFRTHRIPSLKKETIKKKEIIDDLQNGDIIILVPNRDGIDYYDLGFIEMENGKPFLIHVSPQTHVVTKEKEDLQHYMNLMTKHFQGYRILRVK